MSQTTHAVILTEAEMQALQNLLKFAKADCDEFDPWVSPLVEALRGKFEVPAETLSVHPGEVWGGGAVGVDNVPVQQAASPKQVLRAADVLSKSLKEHLWIRHPGFVDALAKVSKPKAEELEIGNPIAEPEESSEDDVTEEAREWIKSLVKEKGSTQTKVAKALGISGPVMSNIMHGGRTVRRCELREWKLVAEKATFEKRCDPSAHRPLEKKEAELDPENDEKFGPWLKGFRKERNLTQEAVGLMLLEAGVIDRDKSRGNALNDDAGWAGNVVSQWERGKPITRELAKKCAVAIARHVRDNGSPVAAPAKVQTERLDGQYCFSPEKALEVLVCYSQHPGYFARCAEKCGVPERAVRLLVQAVPDAERLIKTEKTAKLMELLAKGVVVKEEGE